MEQIGLWMSKLTEALWGPLAAAIDSWPAAGVVAGLLIFFLIVLPLLNPRT